MTMTRPSEGEQTLSAATQATASAVAAHRWYPLVVVVLSMLLAVMTAVSIYLAVTRPDAAAGQTSSPAPTGTSEAEPCFRQAVPC